MIEDNANKKNIGMDDGFDSASSACVSGHMPMTAFIRGYWARGSPCGQKFLGTCQSSILQP
jgi:hypothetical protein